MSRILNMFTSLTSLGVQTANDTVTRPPRPAITFAVGATLATAVVITAAGCASRGTANDDVPSGDPHSYRWTLPAGFPAPIIPADNLMSDAKVALGRRLFYDPRLSWNASFSCSSCHHQAAAFADARNLPLGSTGVLHPRNSMALANVAYQAVFGWADPTTRSLEAQARIPLLGEQPVELGLLGKEAEVARRLALVPQYRRLFAAAFPRDTAPIMMDNITRALAAFERTMLSGNAPYDRFRGGDSSALSAEARQGERLFRRARFGCAECHSGLLFTNAARWVGGPASPMTFLNTGLYNIGGTGAYPTPNTGLFATTRLASDMGRFKVPSLRNVAVSYPYMHDGTVATLEDAIDHYARGGRRLVDGPNPGDGRLNPFKSPLVKGFTITPAEKSALAQFLRSLTDSSFLTDTRFANPWLRH
jgi:cytochrome c peroxidase